MAATHLQPLSADEEAAWRALAHALIVLPRALDAELVAGHGMSLSEYGVLVQLSEVPHRQLRMSELASMSSFTPAGMTRIVDRLVAQGFVERRKCAADGRGSFAVLTDAGFRHLETAYPAHLASVRRHVMDHIDPGDLDAFMRIMSKVSESACRG
ncbi:MarR family winged helix-turn-helix transcriptional regulator [Planotetraspora kaengkrachanensis]|uniref:MarR family transcriptional regulator n=1 Tax=Planotetraspora kaengkrachanensis TaxID=575193 RepID=A0A8J3PSA5_9ACTN|nr:MarR family transcriptional regulator [Planotetraspora kaengkrachanensis]GIG78783.1 MarR family transcriptional regulator [Planotetraspora kaengkrachanensis]